MTTISGYETIVERTLDGLTSLSADVIQVTELIVNGQVVNVADLFNKTTDDSDDILEGVANLFLTVSERAAISANTAARHQPVTIGTANGLSVGGVSGQELSLAAASGSTTGALTSTDWTTFNSKQDTITGAATTITTANLTASRALVSDGSGKVAVSAVTSTELGYVSGVTSSIQTQLNALAGAGAWTINTAPTPDVVRLTDTTHNVAIGATTVPTALTRLYVNGTAQVNDLYVTGSTTVDGSTYIGPLGAITGERLQVNGGIRSEGGNVVVGGGELRVGTSGGYVSGRFGVGTTSVPGSYQFDVTGGGRFTSVLNVGGDIQGGAGGYVTGRLAVGSAAVPSSFQLDVSGSGRLTANANTLTLTGTDHSYQAFWPRGTAAGRKAYIGFPGAGVTDLWMASEDTGKLIFRTSASRGLDINNNGVVVQANDSSSWTEYGPTSFAGWNALLRVGAADGNITAAKSAAIVVTNGNLHIDVARDAVYGLYTNYYAALASSDNKQFRDYSQEWYLGSTYTNRTFRAAMPVQSLIMHYRPMSPDYYAPGVNAWGTIGVLQLAVTPLRQTDYYKIRVKLSVTILQGSSVAFRIRRLIGGAVTGVFSLGTAGVNQGHSRTAPNGANEPGYWTNPPVYIEVWDYPNTQQTLTYYVEYMTYSPAYGFRLNYVTVGGQGGDATGVISTMTVEQYQFSSIQDV